MNIEPSRSALKIFLNGLAVVLPVVLTIALIVWLGTSLERVLGGALRLVLPAEYYLPGLGICVGVLLIFGVGLATRLWLARRLIEFGASIIERIPLANSIYTSIQDVMRFVQTASEPDQMDKVVLVELTGGVKVIGFVTDTAASLPGLGGEDRVPVYLQMSYQMGGYTVFVERDRIEPIDVSFEDAMRWVLSAGISGQANGGKARDD